MVEPYYQEDGITLYCGDCREILPQFKDKEFDLVLTDPPYNFESQGGGLFKKRVYLQKIEDSFGSDFTPELLLIESERLCKVMHGYFWCSKAIVRNYLNWAQCRDYGFNILTWHKSNPIPANNNNFLPDTEYCIFIRGKGTTFNQNLDFSLYRKYNITSVQESNGHPTPKPPEIMKKHIMISTQMGDSILDPFCGSGTTLVAAKQLGRKAVGIEISEKYCEIAVKRLAQMQLEFK